MSYVEILHLISCIFTNIFNWDFFRRESLLISCLSISIYFFKYTVLLFVFCFLFHSYCFYNHQWTLPQHKTSYTVEIFQCIHIFKCQIFYMIYFLKRFFYTHKVWWKHCPRWELSKNTTNGDANMDEKMPTRLQPYIKNYRQLRNVGSWRGGLLYGRAHQLVLSYQVISHKNRGTGSIMCTEQVIFGNMYIYM